MIFLENHTSKDNPLARVLFYSLALHVVLFFIFFGNPFLLHFDDTPEGYEMEKEFDIELLLLPGTDGQPFQIQALGLFPPEVESRGDAQVGLESEVLEISALKPDSAVNTTSDGAQVQTGTIHTRTEPPPLVTGRKLPHNMTGLEDCMIKVVGMVCPHGDAKCIMEYKAFCATLPK